MGRDAAGDRRPVSLPASTVEWLLDGAYGHTATDPGELCEEELVNLLAIRRALNGRPERTAAHLRADWFAEFASMSDSTLQETRDLMFQIAEQVDEGIDDPAFDCFAALDILVSLRVCDSEREVSQSTFAGDLYVNRGRVFAQQGDDPTGDDLELGVHLAARLLGVDPDDIRADYREFPQGDFPLGRATITVTIPRDGES